jgi:hypothetical protein
MRQIFKPCKKALNSLSQLHKQSECERDARVANGHDCVGNKVRTGFALICSLRT